MSEIVDVMPRAKKARKVSLSEMMTRPPKPHLGVLSYGRGQMIAGHKNPGVPKHLLKAVEARRKMTLTSTKI